MLKTAVVIPAGGMGARIGSRTPKQFLSLGGAPILAATLKHFVTHPAIGEVVIAAPPAHLERTRRLIRMFSRRISVAVVPGGSARQESVGLALAAVSPDCDIVVVHDAVRPFITRALIDAVIQAANVGGAAICALPITETVKRVVDGKVETTIDRTGLWAVQTPQAFRVALLREAHEKAQRDGFVGTDDSMLVERLGHPVKIVRGIEANVKITTPEDLRRARSFTRS